MYEFVLSCLFGVACGMGLWVAGSTRAAMDEMIRRHGEHYPRQ
jgi:hypothetical protein